MGIRIDALNPGLASRDSIVPVMVGGETVRLTVGQILDLLIDGAPEEANTLMKVSDAIDAINDALALTMPRLPSGAPLPSSDIGPIFHAAYASMMTWQIFDANGADYEGYASVDIGIPALDGRSTPRAGFFKRNGASVSQATHAALWSWAQHNGRVVSLGSWVAGPFVFADNGDGTFKLPDNRGEFERAWDDSRGIDSGRAFGTLQLDAFQGFHIGNSTGKHGDFGLSVSSGSTVVGAVRTGTTNFTGPVDNGTNGSPRIASETRPRSVALLACIKF